MNNGVSSKEPGDVLVSYNFREHHLHCKSYLQVGTGAGVQFLPIDISMLQGNK